MAKVLQFIWRFDYEPNFEFLDKTGSTAKAIQALNPMYFTDIAHNPTEMSILGSSRTDECIRNIMISPTTMNGDQVCFKGIECPGSAPLGQNL